MGGHGGGQANFLDSRGGIPAKNPPLGETVESNDFKLKIMESLLTGQDNPMFNNTDMLIPLELL